MTDRLGIVYTPVEVVDFIIHSVNDVLKSEFGQTLGSKNVHIIDPFTGTGTFVTRLIQSGLITKEQLPYKYKNELHANEIVPLAYYIAAVNIEAAYHGVVSGEYKPFDGICLTDTFQLYEKEDMISSLMEANSTRRKKQKELDIRVIISNPPYSAGQTSANDNNANLKYPKLDASIENSYARYSTATNKNALYDSYIRGIRWASDRIGNSGVIGFVTNGGFIDSNTADGMRKCLSDEFSSIYIFHLRGNQRTAGELSRKEGGKIFGSGSRAPIAISILVKNPNSKKPGKIYFHDIGDYLTCEDKLSIINQFKSITGITNSNAWQVITPNTHNDWIRQRDNSFTKFIGLGDKSNKNENCIFKNYTRGAETGRDAWVFNSSKTKLTATLTSMICFYNEEISKNKQNIANKINIIENLCKDETKIKWTSSLVTSLTKMKPIYFNKNNLIISQYRPFQNQWLYFDSTLVHRIGQIPKIFPEPNIDNYCICVTGAGGTKSFSTLITKVVPEVHTVSTGQCFPLRLYEPVTVENKNQNNSLELFANDITASESIIIGKSGTKYSVKDGITESGLEHFSKAYPGEKITKEDIFYYIYGILHSEEYKLRFADNLTKELPRIPCVKKPEDFSRFSNAGRKLADLHLNYETIEPYPVQYKEGFMFMNILKGEDYRVNKMKFGKKGKIEDKTTVIYNSKITMIGIPLETYEYIVNGKPALEWVMERQCISPHKESGIINDANDWAIETMHNPKYPMELFQRVITVSLETMKIIKSLPKLDI
jgi:predicted helicase